MTTKTDQEAQSTFYAGSDGINHMIVVCPESCEKHSEYNYLYKSLRAPSLSGPGKIIFLRDTGGYQETADHCRWQIQDKECDVIIANGQEVYLSSVLEDEHRLLTDEESAFIFYDVRKIKNT